MYSFATGNQEKALAVGAIALFKDDCGYFS